jgi:hypothetical protein
MNLNISELTKEQKQFIVLGAIGVLGIGVALIFGIKFCVSSASVAKTELEDLKDKVYRAEQLLKKKTSTREKIYRAMSELDKQLNYIAPEENYYSWATEIVYSQGRKAGLEVLSVDEVGMNQSKGGMPKDPAYFETYSLRINARGSFSQLKVLLSEIERDHPLVRFTGIDIGKGSHPEVHEIQLFIQWPFKLNRISNIFAGYTKQQQIWLAQQSQIQDVAAPSPVIEKTPPPVVAALPAPVIKPAEPTRVEKQQPAPVAARRQPYPPTSRPEQQKPTPVVVKTPEPVIEAAPVKPAPVLVKAPVASVQKVEPVQPEPVRVAPAPIVAPKAIAATPAPVIINEPTPPVSKPEPVKLTPVVEKRPDPVVVLAPVHVPEPVEVVQPVAPVLTASIDAAPSTKPKPEPEPESSDIEALLAEIDLQGDNDPAPESTPDAPEAESDMALLLASLNAQVDDTAPISNEEQVSVQDDLAAYVQQIEAESKPEKAPEPNTLFVESELVKSSQPSEPTVKYVSSSKSANILEKLLSKDAPTDAASLGSFLNGIVEDINDKRN